MENTNLITDRRELAFWLEEIDTDTIHYWNLLLVKHGSEIIVFDEDKIILAKIEISNQDSHMAPFYDAAEKIDDLSAY